MYPPVTQFETRDRLIEAEIRHWHERRARLPQPEKMPRAPVLRLWLVRKLRLA